MRSIGLDLQEWIDKGLLRIEASRPTVSGLEMHLVHIHKRVKDFDPRVVIMDPMSNFTASGSSLQAEAMLVRMVDFLKVRGVTAMLVSLTTSNDAAGMTGISSLIDTWVLLHDVETGGEHWRLLHVRKSRGMEHSNEVRQFRITSKGIMLAGAPPGGEKATK
jgi:circadian clock protein KaiC